MKAYSQKMPRSLMIMAQYHAPRGTKRLYMLAAQLSQQFLTPNDYVIGVIGQEGAGKSTIIQGLFPGLELTNDDEGVNNRSTPIYEDLENNFFAGHTFHLDVRFELAFKQKYQLVDAINKAVSLKKRVVIEHFDLLYESLGYNAQIIFAIGEDLRIYRPTIFGPSPLSIKNEIDTNTKIRLMAHTAEDLTSAILEETYGFQPIEFHSDVRHGFVIPFNKKPDIDLKLLEAEVKKMIKANVPVTPISGKQVIKIDRFNIFCSNKRSHVKLTSEIERFRILSEIKYDQISKEYLLIGLVGSEPIFGFNALPPLEIV